jgi:hypothetical protein
MDEALWRFIDATGEWVSKAYGVPMMAGRVLGWLLVCDPVEQTAAQLAEALGASKGSISGATGLLVRGRPEAWDDQVRDQNIDQARAVLALGLEALNGESPTRRARLEELDAFYAWWQGRMPVLWEEWIEYKKTRLGGRRG